MTGRTTLLGYRRGGFVDLKFWGVNGGWEDGGSGGDAAARMFRHSKNWRNILTLQVYLYSDVSSRIWQFLFTPDFCEKTLQIMFFKSAVKQHSPK